MTPDELIEEAQRCIKDDDFTDIHDVARSIACSALAIAKLLQQEQASPQHPLISPTQFDAIRSGLFSYCALCQCVYPRTSHHICGSAPLHPAP